MSPRIVISGLAEPYPSKTIQTGVEGDPESIWLRRFLHPLHEVSIFVVDA